MSVTAKEIQSGQHEDIDNNSDNMKPVLLPETILNTFAALSKPNQQNETLGLLCGATKVTFIRSYLCDLMKFSLVPLVTDTVSDGIE